MSKKNDIPEIKLEIAEKVLRDIAKRNGEGLKKRRAKWAKDQHGDGYMVFDPSTNTCLDGAHGPANDGCNVSLTELAERYEDDEKNTSWQNIVIKSVRAGKVTG